MAISARKLLLLMLIAISCKATTFTVTLLQPSQVPTSKDAFVRFELKNYGANVPRVIGSNVILSSISDFTPNGSGVVTGNIQGNDTISPANTYYSVGFFKGGTRFYTCDMIISGSSQDLDNTSCLQAGTPPVPFTQCIQCNSGPITRAISFTIGDPAGNTLSSGNTTTDYVTVPFACTISAYNIVIDSGTITVKIWKIGTGTSIPTSANSINTSGVGISAGTAIHSTTLTDFTSTSISANDILAMNVSAVSGAKYVNVVLACTQ